MAKLTPMMEQYFEIKAQYSDCLVFFRLGDFYELFFDDAITASKELDIKLTGRDWGREDKAPMCGVPAHSADNYIKKLVEKGYKVAIGEQVEQASAAKGIVKRDVTRVISKGTVTDASSLVADKNNYIMCVYADKKNEVAVVVCDVTTGEMVGTSISNATSNNILDEITKFAPSEILVNENVSCISDIQNIFGIKPNVLENFMFDYDTCYVELIRHFNTLSLDGFGVEDDKILTIAFGALLRNLQNTQKNGLNHITKLQKYNVQSYMILDTSSRRNLELTETVYEKQKKGSLLYVLDETKTAFGSRMMRKTLELPLIDKRQIEERLDAVQFFAEEIMVRDEIRELFGKMLDAQRLLSRIVYKTATGLDLLALLITIKNVPVIKNLLSECDVKLIKQINEDMDNLTDICELIENNIDEETGNKITDGNLIKRGVDEKLDELIRIRDNGSQMIIEMEQLEREQTGIKNLKIKYNKVLGYFYEITNSNFDLVPEHFVQKATLTGSRRYVTQELNELEQKMLSANEQIVDIQIRIFENIKNQIILNVDRIQQTVDSIAFIDVLQSLGFVADRNQYVKPVITDDKSIRIVGGRHPVVEALSKNQFVPNDTILDTNENRMNVITGPNMAGKSTYMRQTALITVMAQIGSFVPASSAIISPVDRVFTRVGASDNLATGQSTFMVEMNEVANILNNATNNSLLILDEIGRGTSTYDGLSIAWAVLEYIVTEKDLGCKTLFATHYHELTELANKLDGVNNYCVTVKEVGENIIFLHKIREGYIDHSYGVHVAKIAGLPNKVIKRANEILKLLEDSTNKPSVSNEEEIDYRTVKSVKTDIDYGSIILKELESVDIDKITPLEALKLLSDFKNLDK